jgi:hypothetical protein
VLPVEVRTVDVTQTSINRKASPLLGRERRDALRGLDCQSGQHLAERSNE